MSATNDQLQDELAARIGAPAPSGKPAPAPKPKPKPQAPGKPPKPGPSKPKRPPKPSASASSSPATSAPTSPTGADVPPRVSLVVPSGSASRAARRRSARAPADTVVVRELLDSGLGREAALLDALKCLQQGASVLQVKLAAATAEIADLKAAAATAAAAPPLDLPPPIDDLPPPVDLPPPANDPPLPPPGVDPAIVAAKDEEIAALRAELTEAQRAVESAAADRTNHIASFQRAEADLTATRSRVAQLEAELDTARNENYEVKLQLSSQADDIAALRAQLAAQPSPAPSKPTKPARPVSMMASTTTAPPPIHAAPAPAAAPAPTAAPDAMPDFDLSDLDALESELSSFINAPEPVPGPATASDTLDPSYLGAYNTIVDCKLKIQTLVMNLTSATWSATDSTTLRDSLRALGDAGKAFSAAMADDVVSAAAQNDLVMVVRAGMGVLQAVSTSAVESGDTLAAAGATLTASVDSSIDMWCAARSR